MTTSTPHQSTLIRSSSLALCACALFIANANSAFAQIDPNVKNGIGGNMQSKQTLGKGEHNPLADKGQHNPPGDKSGKAGETKVLLPAVKPAEPTKKMDAPKVGAPQTPHN